jgi:hypothetical protein
MASLSAMIQLELPHVNILSKMDLVGNKKDVEEYVFFPSSFIYMQKLQSPVSVMII